MNKLKYKLGQNKRSYRTPLTIAIAVVIVAVLAAGSYLLKQRFSAGTTAKQAKHRTSESRKGDIHHNLPEDDPVEGPEKTPPQYEGENVNNAETLTGVISHKSISDGRLVLRTVINQLLESGLCELTLSRNGEDINQSAEISAGPSSSTCKGFDIPIDDISSGKWNILINISDNSGRTGNITGEVII